MAMFTMLPCKCFYHARKKDINRTGGLLNNFKVLVNEVEIQKSSRNILKLGKYLEIRLG